MLLRAGSVIKDVSYVRGLKRKKRLCIRLAELYQFFNEIQGDASGWSVNGKLFVEGEHC